MQNLQPNFEHHIASKNLACPREIVLYTKRCQDIRLQLSCQLELVYCLEGAGPLHEPL